MRLLAVLSLSLAGSSIGFDAWAQGVELAAGPSEVLEGNSTGNEDKTVGLDASEIPPEAPSDLPTQTPGEEEIAGPPPGVEVMRVKGRAISGIETDAPESVTQFDAEAIAALGAGNIADLATVTPNVEIRSAGATTATFFIRGVGLSDFSSNAAGAVAIYYDDVPYNSPAIQNGALFDTLTVDVKRGPQGAGLFRNASAGAIRILSNKPSGEYEAKLRSSTGSFWSNDARNAFIRDTEGMINLPLVEETLAARIAFRVRRTDPFMTNGCGNAVNFEDRLTFKAITPGRARADVRICGESAGIVPGAVSPVPPGLPRKVGDRQDWAARGALRFAPPGTDMDWLLNLHGSRLDQDSTLGQAIGTQPTAVGGVEKNFFGSTTSKGYVEPDQLEELQELERKNLGLSADQDPKDFTVPGLSSDEILALRAAALNNARDTLARNLTRRSLDRRPFRGDFNKIGRTTRDTFGGFLRGDFSLGDRIDVTTITAYESYERFRDSDNDFSPEVAFEILTLDEAKQFSQDVTLSGQLFEDALRWNVGASYLEESLFNVAFTDVGDANSFPNPIKREFTQETSAYMVTAQFAWDFLEDFTLEVGGRFNHEHKTFEMLERRNVNNPICLDGLFPDCRESSKTWNEPTGGVSLRYHINDQMSIYAKYTHAYKAGHFNSNSNQDIRENGPARPEFIDAYEWGLRGSWVDERIRVGLAFFFYDYKDYQIFVFRDSIVKGEGPALVIRNAEAVQQYGAEFDLSLRPLQNWAPDSIDALKVDIRFGWLASRFLEFTNIVFREDEFGNQFPDTIDFGGNRLINSPEFKVSGTVEWPWDLGEWGTLTPRYDFVWTSEIFFDPTEGRGTLNSEGNAVLPKHAVGQRAFWLHGIRLTYRTPVGNVEVSGWVRNLLDERYKTFAFDASRFSFEVINFVGDPRSAGADVTITW